MRPFCASNNHHNNISILAYRTTKWQFIINSCFVCQFCELQLGCVIGLCDSEQFRGLWPSYSSFHLLGQCEMIPSLDNNVITYKYDNII